MNNPCLPSAFRLVHDSCLLPFLSLCWCTPMVITVSQHNAHRPQALLAKQCMSPFDCHVPEQCKGEQAGQRQAFLMRINAPDLPAASWDEQGCQAVKQAPSSIFSASVAAMQSECTKPSALGLQCAAPEPSKRHFLEVKTLQSIHSNVCWQRRMHPPSQLTVTPHAASDLATHILSCVQPC